MKTQTPNLPYSTKAQINDLGNWIANQKKGLEFEGYNFNQLLDGETKIVLTFIHWKYTYPVQRLADIEITFDNLDKVKQINQVIKSKEFPIQDIYKKIITKFKTK